MSKSGQVFEVRPVDTHRGPVRYCTSRDTETRIGSRTVCRSYFSSQTTSLRLKLSHGLVKFIPLFSVIRVTTTYYFGSVSLRVSEVGHPGSDSDWRGEDLEGQRDRSI